MTLLKRLQDTRAWMTETKGAKHATVKLTAEDMVSIIAALHLSEFMNKRGHNIPQVTPQELALRVDGAKEKLRKALTNCA